MVDAGFESEGGSWTSGMCRGKKIGGMEKKGYELKNKSIFLSAGTINKSCFV